MVTYTNKNRIDAVLRVEKFSIKNAESGTKNIKSELTERIIYNSITVLNPIYPKNFEKHQDVQITNVGVPYMRKDNQKELKKKRDTIVNQVSSLTIKFHCFIF